MADDVVSRMTLKQAKKENSKRGLGLSKAAQKTVDRRGVLEDRAEAVREKERKKKENARKRAAQQEKVRKQRIAQGLPAVEPPKVRASQPRLSFFRRIGEVKARKAAEAAANEEDNASESLEDADEDLRDEERLVTEETRKFSVESRDSKPVSRPVPRKRGYSELLAPSASLPARGPEDVTDPLVATERKYIWEPPSQNTIRVKRPRSAGSSKSKTGRTTEEPDIETCKAHLLKSKSITLGPGPLPRSGSQEIRHEDLQSKRLSTTPHRLWRRGRSASVNPTDLPPPLDPMAGNDPKRILQSDDCRNDALLNQNAYPSASKSALIVSPTSGESQNELSTTTQQRSAQLEFHLTESFGDLFTNDSQIQLDSEVEIENKPATPRRQLFRPSQNTPMSLRFAPSSTMRHVSQTRLGSEFTDLEEELADLLPSDSQAFASQATSLMEPVVEDQTTPLPQPVIAEVVNENIAVSDLDALVAGLTSSQLVGFDDDFGFDNAATQAANVALAEQKAIPEPIDEFCCSSELDFTPGDADALVAAVVAPAIESVPARRTGGLQRTDTTMTDYSDFEIGPQDLAYLGL